MVVVGWSHCKYDDYCYDKFIIIIFHEKIDGIVS
jgi:hypothetical protein